MANAHSKMNRICNVLDDDLRAFSKLGEAYTRDKSKIVI